MLCIEVISQSKLPQGLTWQQRELMQPATRREYKENKKNV